jgi:UDP:flavonoid glycosyltransferase YjiC (YdhE family)
VRILFTSAGKRGHSDPLIPIARASERAGHTVAFSCRAPMGAVLEVDGFTAFEGGPPIFTPDAVAPLVPVDVAHELRVMRERIVGRCAPRVDAVRVLLREWQPDVVVCDETDFGARIAAEAERVPHATVAVLATPAFLAAADIDAPLAEVRVANGLTAEAPPERLSLAPGPPTFRDDPQSVAMQPAALDGDVPPITFERDAVYFTLGSVFNMESGDLFDRVLRGLRELEVDVFVTTGAEFDPATLDAQPSNVRIERFVPQAAVLASARAVVSHAGSGSVLGALAFGLPMVLLPMGADQPFNGTRAEALGVARVLDATTCTPDQVRAAVDEVLTAPSYRQRAEVLRAGTLALPTADEILPLITSLPS